MLIYLLNLQIQKYLILLHNKMNKQVVKKKIFRNDVIRTRDFWSKSKRFSTKLHSKLSPDEYHYQKIIKKSFLCVFFFFLFFMCFICFGFFLVFDNLVTLIYLSCVLPYTLCWLWYVPGL